MSNIQGILIDDARLALVREISQVIGKNDLHEAFAAWLVGDAVPGLGFDEALKVAVKATGAERTYRHVAVVGLAAQVMDLGQEEKSSLGTGLNWLVGRDPMVGTTPMPFCMDVIGLLALVLGARATGDASLWERTCRWMQRCRKVTAGGQGLGNWQEWLMAVVTGKYGILWERKGGDGSESAEVRVALRSKGFEASDTTSSIESDERRVLEIVRSESATNLGVSRAAIRLAALDWIRRARPVADLRSVSILELCDLLRGSTAGLKKWTWEAKPRTKTSPEARKWHVDNEYHVQNLLCFLLAPIFPDLVDEDATPKVGPVQPRADIGIPSLRVIVEAKFMRPTDAPKEMIEQIAEDASLYLVPGSRYDTVIPFIWDDSRRTEHHGDMLKGLRQIRGVPDAVIIPRPGSMQVNVISKDEKAGVTAQLDLTTKPDS